MESLVSSPARASYLEKGTNLRTLLALWRYQSLDHTPYSAACAANMAKEFRNLHQFSWIVRFFYYRVFAVASRAGPVAAQTGARKLFCRVAVKKLGYPGAAVPLSWG